MKSRNFIKGRTKYVVFLFALIVLSTSSCEEIIEIELDGLEEKSLVVEGGITSLPPPYTVNLRASQDLSGVGSNTLGEGAIITLFDDLGISEEMVEISPGNYSSILGQVRGEVGRAYKIHIKLKNGEEYNSDFDLMPKPVVVNNTIEKLEVKQVLTDNLVVISETFYHKIISEVENNKNNSFFIKSTQKFAIIEREIGLDTPCGNFGPINCYVLKQINASDIYITSNIGVSADVLTFDIAEVPIVFRGLYYSLFSIESLSDKAYDYYTVIQKQLQREGDIFDTQIPKIPTNLAPVSGVTRNVEGFFRAYSVTEADICYDRSDVKMTIDVPVPNPCKFCWQHFNPAFSVLPDVLKNCL